MATLVRGSDVTEQTRPSRFGRDEQEPLAFTLVLWLAATVGRLIVWLARHPVTLVMLIAAAGLYGLVRSTSSWTLLLAVVPVLVLGVWARRWPDTFRTLVWARFIGSLRAPHYRLAWQATCEGIGALRPMAGRRWIPRLIKIRSRGAVDYLTVRMLPGQTIEDWAQRGDMLAESFGALECRAKTGTGTRRVELRMLSEDPFRQPVSPFKQTSRVDLRAVPLAQREDGSRLEVPILGNTILFGGTMGSGKSGGMQTVIDQLAPAVSDGLVRLYGIDMKGGIEFAHNAGLFAGFAHSGIDEAIDLVKSLVTDVMAARLESMFGTSRLHTPTVDEPLHVVLIDELAALTSYESDGGKRKEFTRWLNLLLSQGRAPGLSVIAGVQDVRAEVVPMRPLFSYRVAFRLRERDHIKAVLSPEAPDLGARADKISPSRPGVAYVEVDGEDEPVRVRFPHITDERIAATVDRYRRPAPVSNLHGTVDASSPEEQEGDEAA